MFTNQSECDKCGHDTVCKLKDRYRTFTNDIKDVTERGRTIEDKDIFYAIVDCRQWMPKRTERGTT